MDTSVHDTSSSTAKRRAGGSSTQDENRGCFSAFLAIRGAIFGTVFVISKDSVPVMFRTAMAFVLIELLQLVSFPLTLVSGSPALDFVAVVADSLTTGAMERFVDTYGFSIILIVVLLVVVSFLGLTAVVARRFALGRPQSGGALRALRALGQLSTSVLFIPLAGVLMKAFHCNGSDGKSTEYWMGTVLLCSSPGHVSLAVALGIILVFFTLLSLFLAATFVDSNPANQSWTARMHSRMDVAVIAMKLLLTLVWGLSPHLNLSHIPHSDPAGIRAAILLVLLGIAWCWLMWRFAPFIQMKMNAIVLAEACIFLWCSVAALASRLAPATSLDPSLMVLLGSPVVGIAVYNLFLRQLDAMSSLPRQAVEGSMASLELWARLKLHVLLNDINFQRFLQARRSSGGGGKIGVSDCLHHAIRDWKAVVHTATRPRGGDGARDLLLLAATAGTGHPQAGAGTVVDTRSETGLSTVREQDGRAHGAEDDQLGEQLRLALQKPTEQARAAFHLASAQEGIDAYSFLGNNYDSSELAMMMVASFLHSYSPFQYGELLALHRASRLNAFVDTQYRIFRRIRQLQLTTSDGSSSGEAAAPRATGGVVDRVLVEQNIREIQLLERGTYRVAGKLWTALAASVADLAPVVELAERLEADTFKLGNLYKAVLRADPNSTSMLRGYAAFLREQQRVDDAGQEYDNKADRIEEAHTRRMSRSVRHVEFLAGYHGSLDQSDESTPVVVMSGDPYSLGELVEVSLGACRLFHYRSPQQLIGTNVKELIPEPIRSRHDRYLRRFGSKQSSNVIDKALCVFAVTSAGTIIPVWVQVIEAPPDASNAAPRFTAVFEPVTTSENHLIYALPEQGGHIYAGSAGTLELLDLSPESIKGGGDEAVAVAPFFPSLGADGREFHLVVEPGCVRLIDPHDPAAGEEADAVGGRSVVDGALSVAGGGASTIGGDDDDDRQERLQLISAAQLAIMIGQRHGHTPTIAGTSTEVLEATQQRAVLAVRPLRAAPASSTPAVIPVLTRDRRGESRVTVLVGSVQHVDAVDRPFLLLGWRPCRSLLRRSRQLLRSYSSMGTEAMGASSLLMRFNGRYEDAEHAETPSGASASAAGAAMPKGSHNRLNAASLGAQSVEEGSGTTDGDAGSSSPSQRSSPHHDDVTDLPSTAAAVVGHHQQEGGDADGGDHAKSDGGDEEGAGRNDASAQASPTARAPPPSTAHPPRAPGLRPQRSATASSGLAPAWRKATTPTPSVPSSPKATLIGNGTGLSVRTPQRRSSVTFADGFTPLPRASPELPVSASGSRLNRLSDGQALVDDGRSQSSSQTSRAAHVSRLAELVQQGKLAKDRDVARIQWVLLAMSMLVVVLATANLVWVSYTGERLTGLVTGLQRAGQRAIKGHRCMHTMFEVVMAEAGLPGYDVAEKSDLLLGLVAEVRDIQREISVAGSSFSRRAAESERTNPLQLNELNGDGIVAKLENMDAPMMANAERAANVSSDLAPCHNFTDCDPKAFALVSRASMNFYLTTPEVMVLNAMNPEYVYQNESLPGLEGSTDVAVMEAQRAYLNAYVPTISESSILTMSQFGDYWINVMERVATATDLVGFADPDVHTILANDGDFFDGTNRTVQLTAAELLEVMPAQRIQLGLAGICSFIGILTLQLWLVGALVRRVDKRVRAVARLLLLIPRRTCQTAATSAMARWNRLADTEEPNSAAEGEEMGFYDHEEESTLADTPAAPPSAARLLKPAPERPSETAAAAAPQASVDVPRRGALHRGEPSDGKATTPSGAPSRRWPGAGKAVSLRPHTDTSSRAGRQNLRLALPLLPTLLWLGFVFTSQMIVQSRLENFSSQLVMANLMAQATLVYQRGMLEAVLAPNAIERAAAQGNLRQAATEIVQLADVGMFGGPLYLKSVDTTLHASTLEPGTPEFTLMVNDACSGSPDEALCRTVSDGIMTDGAYAASLRLVTIGRTLLAALPPEAEEPGTPLMYGERPRPWLMYVAGSDLVQPHLKASYERMSASLADELHTELRRRWQRSLWATVVFAVIFFILRSLTYVWAKAIAQPLHSVRALLTKVPRQAYQTVGPLRQAMQDMVTEPDMEVVNVKFASSSLRLAGHGGCGCRSAPKQKQQQHHHHHQVPAVAHN